MKLRRIDHIGLIVEDLEAAKDFFVALGMEVMCDGEVGGGRVDRIIGLEGTQCSMSMLKTPDGDANLELVKFHTPQPAAGATEGLRDALPNVPGFRHLAFVVEDIEGMVAKLEKKGATLMGEIVNYENAYKLCHLRGPEGVILELAEELGD